MKRLLLFLLVVCSQIVADTYSPPEKPKLLASRAAEILELHFEENKTPELYIDRMWLIKEDSGARSWVFSVSVPDAGYLFYRVISSHNCYLLEGNELELLLNKILPGRPNMKDIEVKIPTIKLES